MNQLLPPEVEEVFSKVIGTFEGWPDHHRHVGVDLLEHVIHLYRIQNRHLENSIRFEEMVRCNGERGTPAMLMPLLRSRAPAESRSSESSDLARM
jgi:hypothetical protein